VKLEALRMVWLFMEKILARTVIIMEKELNLKFQAPNPKQFQISNVQRVTSKAVGSSFGTWSIWICLGFLISDLGFPACRG
jgi:hypothetical protein